jgi:hypothetical protein
MKIQSWKRRCLEEEEGEGDEEDEEEGGPTAVVNSAAAPAMSKNRPMPDRLVGSHSGVAGTGSRSSSACRSLKQARKAAPKQREWLEWKADLRLKIQAVAKIGRQSPTLLVLLSPKLAMVA